MQSVPKLSVQRVSKSFTNDGAKVQALDGVSLFADDGEFVSIIGPSGCGKSTLFNIIAGLEEPTDGIVLTDGQQLGIRSSAVGYMPQKDLLLPWRTILDNVVIGLELQGVARSAARQQAMGYLEEFGLAGFEHRYPHTLSGGMRQRAAFLRTLLPNNDILLLDEPFGALDALTRTGMQEWLLRIWEAHRKTVLFVTHDVDEAVFLSDRVYVMTARPGRIKRELAIDLPRPRSLDIVANPRYVNLKAELLAAIREESVQQMQLEAVAVPVAAAPAVRLPAPPALPDSQEAAAAEVMTLPTAPAPATLSRLRAAATEYLAPLVLALAFLAAWQIATVVTSIPPWQLPSPWQIGEKLVTEWRLLAPHAWVTLKETLLGFLLAFGAGVALAIGIAYSRLLERSVYPYVIASQTIPIIAIAPMLVAWFGFGILPKVIVVALITFFPIVVNTVDGLRSMDPDLGNLMRALGASRWDIFRKVQVPSALPFLFSGTKIAIAVSVIGAVIGEWVGASEGLGYIIVRASSQFLTARLFAAIVILSIMGIVLFMTVSRLERVLLPWYRTEERAGIRRQR